jgi:hypothetical protein
MRYPVDLQLLARGQDELLTTAERERLAVSLAAVDQFLAELNRVQHDAAAQAFERLTPEAKVRNADFRAERLREASRAFGQLAIDEEGEDE